MPLVQVVYNVQTPQVFVLVMLDTKAPNVILLVVVILLVQVVHRVISQQGNVHAILDIQEPLVTHATPTTIQQVLVQLVQVSLYNLYYK